MEATAKFLVAIVAAGVLGLAALNAHAGQTHYRWLDDRGNPVHSDRPPPEGIDYEVVSTESSLIRQVDAEEGAVPPEVDPKPGNEFKQVNKSAEMQATPKNPEYCKRAQENLNTLNTSARIRLRDDNGEFRFLSEEEKAEQRAKAEEIIELYCE